MNLTSKNIIQNLIFTDYFKNQKKNSMANLWKRFIPLSISDFIMALGDTFRILALSYLPLSTTSISSIGIAKAVIVFFEAPIIMILHASTYLAPKEVSRKALFNFLIVVSILLTIFLTCVSINPIYSKSYDLFFKTSKEVKENTQLAFYFLILWPAMIAWRRFFQGILISLKEEKFIVYASVLRLISTAIILYFGVLANANPIYLGSISLIIPVLIETVIVVFYYLKKKKNLESLTSVSNSAKSGPSTILEITNYYFPLAMTMIFFWTGRALVTAYVSQDHNADLAVACWAAALSFVIPISNATRMLQQVILSSDDLSFKEIFKFSASIGIVFGLVLIFLAFSTFGQKIILVFLGVNYEIYDQLIPIIKIFSILPLATSIQNMFQVVCILKKKNKVINIACLLGIISGLILMKVLMSNGVDGPTSATYSTLITIIIEILILYFSSRKIINN